MGADPGKIAWKASRTCPECDGLGLAVRYRQRSVGAPAILYCVCPYGALLRQEGRAPEGTLDLWDYPWLQGVSGAVYYLPPRTVPTPLACASAGATTAPRASEWWRTGRPEPNQPASTTPSY